MAYATDVARLLRGARFSSACSSAPARAFTTTIVVRGPFASGIKADHQRLRSYYPHIADTKDTEERTRYQNMFVWELARHSVAKELILFPAIEKEIPDGTNLAKRGRDNNQKIKQELYKFQGLNASDHDFLPTFEGLYSNLLKGDMEEEAREAKQLEDHINESESLNLSKAFDRTKLLAPTRSHPTAPAKSPFESASVMLATPIDKIADIFRKFPKQDVGQDYLDTPPGS
ncbi:hypothetical protein F4809DRAFT_194125 [Biscogniauxia mediterranea]|nr:hypothetical protein F4809DRAFT_194125 [Biscogniauxia mediterranea]